MASCLTLLSQEQGYRITEIELYLGNHIPNSTHSTTHTTTGYIHWECTLTNRACRHWEQNKHTHTHTERDTMEWWSSLVTVHCPVGISQRIAHTCFTFTMCCSAGTQPQPVYIPRTASKLPSHHKNIWYLLPYIALASIAANSIGLVPSVSLKALFENSLGTRLQTA